MALSARTDVEGWIVKYFEALSVAEQRRLSDLAELKTVGLTDEDAWDIAAVAAFFGFSNRMAGLMDMRPNPQFYEMGRAGASR